MQDFVSEQCSDGFSKNLARPLRLHRSSTVICIILDGSRWWRKESKVPRVEPGFRKSLRDSDSHKILCSVFVGANLATEMELVLDGKTSEGFKGGHSPQEFSQSQSIG